MKSTAKIIIGETEVLVRRYVGNATYENPLEILFCSKQAGPVSFVIGDFNLEFITEAVYNEIRESSAENEELFEELADYSYREAEGLKQDIDHVIFFVNAISKLAEIHDAAAQPVFFPQLITYSDIKRLDFDKVHDSINEVFTQAVSNIVEASIDAVAGIFKGTMFYTANNGLYMSFNCDTNKCVSSKIQKRVNKLIENMNRCILGANVYYSVDMLYA